MSRRYKMKSPTFEELNEFMDRQPIPTSREAAKHFGVSRKTIRNRLTRFKDIPRRKPVGDLGVSRRELMWFFNEHPTALVKEAARKLKVSERTLYNALHRWPDVLKPGLPDYKVFVKKSNDKWLVVDSYEKVLISTQHEQTAEIIRSIAEEAFQRGTMEHWRRYQDNVHT